LEDDVEADVEEDVEEDVAINQFLGKPTRPEGGHVNRLAKYKFLVNALSFVR
jgi:hypothetical protein